MMYVDASVTSFCRVLSVTPQPFPRQRPFVLSVPQRLHCARIHLSFLFILLLFSTLLSPAMSLYSFGQKHEDSKTQKLDDGGSGRIELNWTFTFYGRGHTKLFVNNNGVISFLEELRGYRPKSFPLEELTPIIAPFWADVDIKDAGGTVWYRQTFDEVVLRRITEDVKRFSTHKKFQAKWAFIATWDGVGFYGAVGEGLNKNNTFQCVLTSDGTRSYTIFNYQTLQWTTGSNSQGAGSSSETGLGGNPAQVGFNAGNRVDYYTLPGAGNDSVINLTLTSNVCEPGWWVYEVDTTVADSNYLALTPRTGSMLGGYEVNITGYCSSSAQPPSVQGIINNHLTFPCAWETSSDLLTLRCVMPMWTGVGKVTVSLLVDGKPLDFSGDFSFENPGLLTPEVLRHSPDQWVAWSTVWVSLQPSSWVPPLFSSDQSIFLDVMAYREAEQRLVVMERTPLDDMSGASEDKVRLVLPPLTNATLAVVRIQVPHPLIDGSYLSYWSDVFPVRWKSSALSEAWCSHWLSQEKKLPPLSARESCPCLASQATSDTGRLKKDLLCSSSTPDQCLNRGVKAHECFTSTFNGPRAANILCCYDSNNELLNVGEGGGGSMLERYSPDSQGGLLVPWFSYLAEEVAPFLHCCSDSANALLCGSFLEARPQLSCQGYRPPAAAQAAGDPHLVTLDGLGYTFNGEGDFVLLRDESGRVRVHVHAARAVDIDGQLGNATLFTAVAMSVVNETQVVEIRLDEEETAVVLVDGEEADLDTSFPELTGLTLYRNQTGPNTVEFTVVMDTVGLSVLVSATPDLLNIMVLVGSSELTGKLEGLLGNYNGKKEDDLRSRQGRLIPMTSNMSDIHYLFGMTWYLERNETLLTHSDQDSGTSAGHDFVPVFIDTIQDDQLRNGTEELCQGNLQCIFDMLMTDKESIGRSTKQFSDRFETVVKEIAPVVRCPYVQQLVNGNRTLEGQAVGNKVYFRCEEGYTLTNGTSMLVCLDSGKWSGTAPDCVIDLSQDKQDVLLYIAIGSAFGGFVVVIVLAALLLMGIRKCRRKYVTRTGDTVSEPEQFELPRFFDPSAAPNPVFENPLFLSSLHNLKRDEGRFQIPRPRYVDPKIHTEYF